MTFAGLVTTLVDFIRSTVSVLIGIGLVIFLWGIVKYIYQSASPKAHGYGRDMMVWGLVAMFVMVSVWGILGMAQTAFLP